MSQELKNNDANELILNRAELMAGVRLTDTGVEVDEDMPLEEWKKRLYGFKWMMTKVRLGFADFLAFGRRKYGKEAVDQCLEQLEFDLPTVTAALDISTVPLEMRHDNLTAEHYVVLARSKLPVNEMQNWSNIASIKELTPIQLKVSIATGSVLPAAKSQSHGVATIQGLRQEFQIWFKRVGGLEGIRAMPPDIRAEIINEIEPIGQLWEELLGRPVIGRARRKRKVDPITEEVA